MNNKYNRILKTIANQNGVSVNKVKKDIEVAIDIAIKNPHFKDHQISCKGETPSVSEFLDYIINKINSH
jgi:hypothetical protein